MPKMMKAEEIKEFIDGGNDWLGRMERQDKIAYPDQPPSEFCTWCGIPKQEMVAKVNAIAATALAHAETIRNICQTVHQAYGHEGEPAECRNGVCDNLKTI